MCEIKVKNPSDLVWDRNRQHGTKTHRKYPRYSASPCYFPRPKRAWLAGGRREGGRGGMGVGLAPWLLTVKFTAPLPHSSTIHFLIWGVRGHGHTLGSLGPSYFAPLLKTWKHCYPIFHGNNSIFKI